MSISTTGLSQIGEVADIMENIIDLLKALYVILTEQQDALVKGDVEKITQKANDQIEIIRKISEIERRRKSLLRSISAESGRTSDIEFTELLEIAGEAYRARLENISSAMKEVLQALGRVNRQNSMLIRQSLSYIDRTLKMIAGEDGLSKVYTESGAVKSQTGRLAIDSKF